MKSIKCWIPLRNQSQCSIAMKTFLILLLAVAVASAARTHTKRASYSANLNDYVDQVIDTFQSFVTTNNLDPLSLPNVTQSFSTKPLLITYSGRLSLFEGALSNLASVKRYGDVALTYADKVLGFDANLGVDEIGIDYTYQAKLIGITVNGDAVGTVKNIDIKTSLTADLETSTFALESFAIDSVGTTTVRLSGNSVTDWLANVIINIAVAIIKDSAIDTVTSTAASTIEDSLTTVNDYLASLRN